MHQTSDEGKGVPLVEEKLLRLDGTSIDVETAAVPITYEGRPAIQVVIRDLTARRAAEEERQRERRRIAHDLHDSLGHYLGFLHLKFDQLLDVDDLGNTIKVRQELGQMRAVTHDAYELVRDMLAAFLPTNAADLSTALLTLAHTTGKKADFSVRFLSEGQSRPLAPVTQQQTLYLFKEALNNVAKHAGAHYVDIDLLWKPETLTIALTDDGCGFQTDGVPTAQTEGHFGLTIMQERATETGGNLTVNSRPGSGTEVVFQLPLKPIPERAMGL
jgi:two-component system nitrate/nitrite sensor histidine kinase NarX